MFACWHSTCNRFKWVWVKNPIQRPLTHPLMLGFLLSCSVRSRRCSDLFEISNEQACALHRYKVLLPSVSYTVCFHSSRTWLKYAIHFQRPPVLFVAGLQLCYTLIVILTPPAWVSGLDFILSDREVLWIDPSRGITNFDCHLRKITLASQQRETAL